MIGAERRFAFGDLLANQRCTWAGSICVWTTSGAAEGLFARRRGRLNARPARKKPYVCVLIWLGGVVGHLRSTFCLVVGLPFRWNTRRAELKRKRTRFFAGRRLIVGPRVASLRPRALGRGSGVLRLAPIGRVLPPRMAIMLPG